MNQKITVVSELTIAEAIAQERRRQDEKWGGPEHDDRHHPADFIDYIKEHANKALEAFEPSDEHHHDLRPVDPDLYQRRLIEVAALAVAALEAHARCGRQSWETP